MVKRTTKNCAKWNRVYAAATTLADRTACITGTEPRNRHDNENDKYSKNRVKILEYPFEMCALAPQAHAMFMEYSNI